MNDARPARGDRPGSRAQPGWRAPGPAEAAAGLAAGIAALARGFATLPGESGADVERTAQRPAGAERATQRPAGADQPAVRASDQLGVEHLAALLAHVCDVVEDALPALVAVAAGTRPEPAPVPGAPAAGVRGPAAGVGAPAAGVGGPAPPPRDAGVARRVVEFASEWSARHAATDAVAPAAPLEDIQRRLASLARTVRAALAGDLVDGSVAGWDQESSMHARLLTACVEVYVHTAQLVGDGPGGAPDGPGGTSDGPGGTDGKSAADPRYAPEAEHVCVRVLTGVLQLSHPGHALEVRVPGHTAVSCLSGPVHTRGTPPGVVETSAAVFCALAAGQLDFATAVCQGRVHASGVRAEMSGVFPLLR